MSRGATPALATKMSRRPKRSSILRAAADMASKLVTSARTCIAVPPVEVIPSTTATSGSNRRPVRATAMPASRFVEDIANAPFLAGAIEAARQVRFGSEGDLGWCAVWRCGGNQWATGCDPPDDLYVVARSDR